jgi:hypothetical protein
MPKLGPGASKEAKRSRMKTEMDKWKAGDLHSGSKHGPVVKSQEQAIAIGLSESGQSRKSKRASSRRSGRR